MKVSFFGSVQEYTGHEKCCEAAGADSLHALIDALGERYGARLRKFLLGDNTCIFLLNGKSVLSAGGPDVPLSPDDTVEVLPFVDGG